jgi:hypothetical protein
MFSLDRSRYPCRRHQATLHGVVFDILVWGELRVPRTKSPALRRDLPCSSCSRFVQVRTNGRPCPADRVSGPSDPAAAGRAFGRCPAAGRASDPDSGAAGPVSRSGWTSGSPFVGRHVLVGRNGRQNPEIRNWFQGNSGSAAGIEWQRFGATVAAGTRRPKLPLYKPIKPQPSLLPHRVPTVRK